jgi:hypothetical protein
LASGEFSATGRGYGFGEGTEGVIEGMGSIDAFIERVSSHPAVEQINGAEPLAVFSGLGK